LKLKGSCQAAISKFISRLENSYTQYYNGAHKHSGVIFEGMFKSKHVTNEEYFEYLIYYINLNAVKHKIVKNIEDWKYTSHHEYANSKNKEFSIIDKYDFVDIDFYRNNLSKYNKKFKVVEKNMRDCLCE